MKKKYIIEDNNKLFKDPKKNMTALITLIKKILMGLKKIIKSYIIKTKYKNFNKKLFKRKK